MVKFQCCETRKSPPESLRSELTKVQNEVSDLRESESTAASLQIKLEKAQSEISDMTKQLQVSRQRVNELEPLMALPAKVTTLGEELKQRASWAPLISKSPEEDEEDSPCIDESYQTPIDGTTLVPDSQRLATVSPEEDLPESSSSLSEIDLSTFHSSDILEEKSDYFKSLDGIGQSEQPREQRTQVLRLDDTQFAASRLSVIQDHDSITSSNRPISSSYGDDMLFDDMVAIEQQALTKQNMRRGTPRPDVESEFRRPPEAPRKQQYSSQLMAAAYKTSSKSERQIPSDDVSPIRLRSGSQADAGQRTPLAIRTQSDCNRASTPRQSQRMEKPAMNSAAKRSLEVDLENQDLSEHTVNKTPGTSKRQRLNRDTSAMEPKKTPKPILADFHNTPATSNHPIKFVSSRKSSIQGETISNSAGGTAKTPQIVRKNSRDARFRKQFRDSQG